MNLINWRHGPGGKSVRRALPVYILAVCGLHPLVPGRARWNWTSIRPKSYVVGGAPDTPHPLPGPLSLEWHVLEQVKILSTCALRLTTTCSSHNILMGNTKRHKSAFFSRGGWKIFFNVRQDTFTAEYHSLIESVLTFNIASLHNFLTVKS